MKILSIFILTILPLISHSQKLYASLSGGYNFILGEQNLTNNSINNYFGIVYPYSLEKVNVSLGKGTNIDFGIGYQFKKHFGIELLGTYNYGAEIKGTTQYVPSLIYTRSISANMVKINPNIRLTTKNPTFNQYMRIGVIMGYGKIRNIQREDKADTIVMYYENVFSGGMSFGLNSGIGVNYKLNNRFSLFAEFTFVAMSYAPQKGEVVKYISYNEDVLSTLSVSQREFLFKDEIEVNNNQPINENNPSIRLKHAYPFNSFGFKFGVSFNLWQGNVEKNPDSLE